VLPDARSHGVGRALLTALEEACRELGYDRVRLDAGPAQTHSKSLFERTGYVPIPKYNDNHIADYFAEKDLRAGLRSGRSPGPAARPPRAR
jgi:GNAT superfamily N-acetyltransferase